MLSRARITRFIATVLAIALSTQIAGAQVANCMKMSVAHRGSGHSEMSHHTTRDGVKAATRSPQSETPSDAGCSQSVLCINAPAILNATPRAVGLSHIASAVSFGSATFETRALHPDSPPPKI
jgi:hypothetical protein